jgi:hypothetical protein
MDCCCSGANTSKETPQNACGGCDETGRDVSRQTVVHHVKSEKLFSVGDEEYKFCSSQNCAVVYYAVSGQTFMIDDARELVTSKTTGDARPLCYCFGFTEGFARQEIARTGESSVSKQVSRFIKEKLCSCEIRNPSGVCCLGEINKILKHLAAEIN